ncbi:hypothetical protein Hanom_Chr12g01162921 [Helianthus anomalus]
MNSVYVCGFYLLACLGGYPHISCVAFRLTLAPRSGLFQMREDGKREKGERKETVAGGSSPSHHHRGHHLLQL